MSLTTVTKQPPLELIIKSIQGDLNSLSQADHHDPFSVLGLHSAHQTDYYLLFLPDSRAISIELLWCNGSQHAPDKQSLTAQRIGDSDFFITQVLPEKSLKLCLVHRVDSSGQESEFYDPYAFSTCLSDFDLDLFSAGKHLHIYNHLGAQPYQANGIDGILFSTWAPNASRVSVIGDFNHWDGRRHPMRNRGENGIWEIFIPGLGCAELYKYEIKPRGSDQIIEKSDPYAQQFELRPKTASVTTNTQHFSWRDTNWLNQRQSADWLHQPLSIYECHLGSWQRADNGEFLDYRELAHRLVNYVKPLGFTHIELLPITEHPLDASWGYQTTGYFAPTRRFGEAADFQYFVDYCHQHHLGVFLDWVPAHFPKDPHALAGYDGTTLFEHQDPRRGEHRDWGTLIYNYGRNEVRNFLIASALFWLERYHIDGLRVDAVASMLYLDYSREPNDWIPNEYGGNENLEAIAFIRELNTLSHQHHPGTLIMAEESTAWPQVTRPCDHGGLGFSMKWNMGWMHDTLAYFQYDPVHRPYHHNQLTFGLLYSFNENFILPFSHDEVVHGKSSLLYKMPGDEWQKFANLRLLYTYMFTYPGKKLLYMGCEFAQGEEWNHDKPLDWYVLEYPLHQGIKQLIKDLNHLYTSQRALHYYDFEAQGFEWVDCQDHSQSVISYIRQFENELLIIILNFTPVIRENYHIGVPLKGKYRIIFNSDSDYYAGSNAGSHSLIHSKRKHWMSRKSSISLTLPPLGGLILQYDSSTEEE